MPHDESEDVPVPVQITETTVKNILTRTTGYLRTVTSHSLQPYRGCTFGNALCGVGCYVRHNGHILRGRTWGGFLEVRTNAAESYRQNYERECRWARQRDGRFSIFCSSSTDPFVPHESKYGITRSILQAMCEAPPDELVLQTHTHLARRSLPLFRALAALCDLRVHVSIETDRERIPGLPRHASPVAQRLELCAALKRAGLRTVVTVSPLLPIADPRTFLTRISEVADAVVVDHYIEGDGSPDGSRTARTSLPAVMQSLDATSTSLEYRDRIVEIAREILPGRVGVGSDGFSGRYA